ncbi:MAG: DUF924 family protein [Ideonella sp.]|nr:DUF924 family protein [Ideonella sp.]
MPVPPRAGSIVTFWREAGPQAWFRKDAAFDDRFREAFLDDHFAAARRERDPWAASAEGALALLLLLDQFPRNAFRGTAHMFATDPLARHVARAAVAAGHDRRVDEPLRLFFYLPFAHSEDPADQAESLRLHHALGPEGEKHAIGHAEIVRRFGRFPHRNPLLGRETTAEEADFLGAGGFAG